MWRHDIVPKAIIYNATIRVRRGPTAPAGFHLLRAVQRHAIGPEVITNNAAVSVCEKRQLHQQAWHLLRRCDGTTSGRM